MSALSTRNYSDSFVIHHNRSHGFKYYIIVLFNLAIIPTGKCWSLTLDRVGIELKHATVFYLQPWNDFLVNDSFGTIPLNTATSERIIDSI